LNSNMRKLEFIKVRASLPAWTALLIGIERRFRGSVNGCPDAGSCGTLLLQYFVGRARRTVPEGRFRGIAEVIEPTAGRGVNVSQQ